MRITLKIRNYHDHNPRCRYSRYSHCKTIVMIEIENLTKVYKENRGLFPTSFKVKKAELVAIVGHNGAGKSTLLKILSSALLPDSGKVTIDGIPLANRLELVKRIAFVSETPNLYDFFSVEYNLSFFSKLFNLPDSRVEETLNNFNLTSFRKTKVLNLSKGLKQRVSIGRALLADPPVIFLMNQLPD